MNNIIEELEEKGMLATFDINTPQGLLNIVNAKNGSSTPLNDISNGEKFIFDTIVIYKETIENYGSPQEANVCVLSNQQTGYAYSSISKTVFSAIVDIFPMLNDGVVEEVTAEVIKKKSKTDQEFISLQFSL